MTAQEKEYAAWCAEHDVHSFYIWSRWLTVRRQVLMADRYECTRCKARKKYTRANTVHHVNHFTARPDLALEMWYTDPATHEARRNLVSLCHACHEEVHGRSHGAGGSLTTEERWD